MNGFDFNPPSPARSPRSPRTPQRSPERQGLGGLDSRELGWSPAQVHGSPIGVLEEANSQGNSRSVSPISASHRARGDSMAANAPLGRHNSVDVAIQRPVAQRLEQVAQPHLVPEAMSAIVYDDGADWESVYHDDSLHMQGHTAYSSHGSPSRGASPSRSPYESRRSPYESPYESSRSPVGYVVPLSPHRDPQSSVGREVDLSEQRLEDASVYEEYAESYAESYAGSYAGSYAPESPYADSSSPYPDQFQDKDDGFKYIVPTNIVVSQHQDPNAVHYPAPVPSQLKLPPILSHRNRDKSQLPTRKPRPKSMLRMGVPLQPEWDPSPIDQEMGFHPEHESDIDSLLVESDASSYATRDSDGESYQEDAFSDDEFRPHRRRQRKQRAPVKKESWITNAMYAVIGKGGDADRKDKQLVEEQEDIMEEYDETAFLKYDADFVRQEAKRFETGGVYSGTHSSGKPTSLIEELEIRKMGRARQRKGIVRDAVNAQQNLSAANKFAHPLDKEQQPTLLQLQQVAEVDYSDRKRWHHEATMRQKQERGDESLAQRRARRKAANKPQEQPYEAPATETLAERRARLKADKEYRQGLIVHRDVGADETDSVVGVDHPHGDLDEHDQEHDGLIESTPIAV